MLISSHDFLLRGSQPDKVELLSSESSLSPEPSSESSEDYHPEGGVYTRMCSNAHRGWKQTTFWQP